MTLHVVLGDCACSVFLVIRFGCSLLAFRVGYFVMFIFMWICYIMGEGGPPFGRPFIWHGHVIYMPAAPLLLDN